MQMRTMGPAAGWSWFKAGFTAARGNRKAIFGASALALICVLLLSAVQLSVQYVVKPQGSGMLALLGMVMLVSAVLYPILLGGFLRVIDANRDGRTARAMMVCEPFRTGQGGRPLALFGLSLMLVYMLFLAIVLATVGRGVVPWYIQVL